MGVQAGVMVKRRKMDLEELRKSFPSLDEISLAKLLGGGGVLIDGDYWDENWNVGPYGDRLTYSEFQQEMGHLGFSGGSGQGRPTGGGGYAYFGDTDAWDDHYGDMSGAGWADDWGGSGADEPGGGNNNPGGWEGGYDEERMRFPSFSILWGNYPPSVDGAPAHPSVDPYPNQCAIRVGYALQQSGVDISSYPEINQTTDGYPRSSQGLADWIWQNFGPPRRIPIEEFRNDYLGRTGLIFESPIVGSGVTPHIDLWNEGSTGSGFYVGGILEVWFWPIN